MSRRQKLSLPTSLADVPHASLSHYDEHGTAQPQLDMSEILTTGPVRFEDYSVIIFDFDDTLLSQTCYDATKFNQIYDRLLELTQTKLIVVISHAHKWPSMLERSGRTNHREVTLDSELEPGVIWSVPLLSGPAWTRVENRIARELKSTSECGPVDQVRSSKASSIALVLKIFMVPQQTNILFMDDQDWILCDAKMGLSILYPNLKVYRVNLGEKDSIFETNIFSPEQDHVGGYYYKYHKYKSKYLDLKHRGGGKQCIAYEANNQGLFETANPSYYDTILHNNTPYRRMKSSITVKCGDGTNGVTRVSTGRPIGVVLDNVYDSDLSMDPFAV